MKMLEVLPLQVTLCQTGQVFSAFPRRLINDWEKTKVNILAMFPEIPVGGCFKYFLKELKLTLGEKSGFPKMETCWKPQGIVTSVVSP